MDLTPKRDYVIMTTRMRDRSVWRRTMESRWPDDDLDAAREQAAHIVEMAKYYGRPDDVAEVFELCEPGAVDAAYRAGREDAARDIERPGSILCSCSDCDNPPTNWKTRARMDHHCDCAAVEAAATMLGAYSKTNHAQQCVHGTEFDEYYQADQPRTVSPGEQGDNPEDRQ